MRHGMQSVIYLVILFLLAVVAVLISSYAGKAAIDSGSGQTEGAAASLSPGAAQSSCTIFCGRYISRTDDEKKKAKCGTCMSEGIKRNIFCDDAGADAAKKCPTDTVKTFGCTTALADETTCYSVLQELKSSAGTGTGTGVVSTLPGAIYLYELEGSTKIPVSKINFRNGEFSGVNDVYVGVKKEDGTDMSFDSLDLQLQQAGTAEDANKNCGLTADGKPAGLACMTSAVTSFKLPVHPMKDSDSYGILITAKSGGSTLAQVSWPFSWRCPEIKLGGDFGAGYEMTAEFESEIGSKDDVTLNIKPKGSTIPGTRWNPGSAAGRTANFKLPKLGAGVIEGENLLTVSRKDKGLCIKTEGTTDVVKNELSVVKPWACPDTGCTEKGGSQYVAKTKQDGGGYVDFQTGCSYQEKVEPKCAHGCTKGKCMMPDLQIASASLDYLPSGELGESLYEYEKDRTITVGIKNVGSWAAYDVATTATLDGKELNPLSSPEKVDAGAIEYYKFMLPGGTPAVQLPNAYVTSELSATATGSDEKGGKKIDANPDDNTKLFAFKVYDECCSSCLSPQPSPPPQACKAQSICTACPSCAWDAKKTPACAGSSSAASTTLKTQTPSPQKSPETATNPQPSGKLSLVVTPTSIESYKQTSLTAKVSAEGKPLKGAEVGIAGACLAVSGSTPELEESGMMIYKGITDDAGAVSFTITAKSAVIPIILAAYKAGNGNSGKVEVKLKNPYCYAVDFGDCGDVPEAGGFCYRPTTNCDVADTGPLIKSQYAKKDSCDGNQLTEWRVSPDMKSCLSRTQDCVAYCKGKGKSGGKCALDSAELAMCVC